MDQHWLLSIRPAFAASFLKKLLRIRRRVVETEHGRFFVDPASNLGNAIITQPAYEPQMLSALTSILKEGDLYLDVGSNEGYFSVIASKLVGDSGRVLSIEPQSRLQEIIYRNIELNNSHNIHVFQLAVSDVVGTARISLLPDMNTGGSGLFPATKYKIPIQLVPQTTLSRFLSLVCVPKVRLMKLDIEGYEYEAILGSRDLFAGGVIEHIALELHPSILAQRGKSGDDIITFLKECGYQQNVNYQTLIMSKIHS
jgi:FkbM family methyltransferase